MSLWYVCICICICICKEQKAWKAKRYQFYNKDPESEEEQKLLLEVIFHLVHYQQEYRNVVRTVENLLYLLRSQFIYHTLFFG